MDDISTMEDVEDGDGEFAPLFSVSCHRTYHLHRRWDDLSGLPNGG